MNRQTLLLSGLALVLVVALWWMFLYSPAREDLAALESDIVAAEDQALTLRTRITQLEGVRAAAPETEALIAQLSSIVPADPALAGAIRQIEAAAEDAGTRVGSLSVSRPAAVTDGAALHGMGVSMTITGSYFQIVDFLRRLEDPTVTARGVRFSTLSLATGTYPELTAAVTGSLFAVLDPVPEAGVEPEPTTAEVDVAGEGDSDAEPLQEEGGVE